MDDLKMQKQTLKKAYKKTKRKHITPWKILAIICAVVMIVSIPLSILLQKFDNTMAARFGGSFWKLQNEDANAQYYTSDFNSAEEMVNYGLALTQQVEAEGAALLMNNNNALPLAADAKVSTFSSSSANLVDGGDLQQLAARAAQDTHMDLRLGQLSQLRLCPLIPGRPVVPLHCNVPHTHTRLYWLMISCQEDGVSSDHSQRTSLMENAFNPALPPVSSLPKAYWTISWTRPSRSAGRSDGSSSVASQGRI